MIHNAEWVECKVCGRVLDHVVCVGKDERQYVKAIACPSCAADSWYGGVCEAKVNLALWNEEDFQKFFSLKNTSETQTMLLKALKEAVTVCKSAAMMPVVYNEWEKIIKQAEEISSSRKE